MIVNIPNLRTSVAHVDEPINKGDFALRYSDAPENQNDPKPPTTNAGVEKEAKTFLDIFPKFDMPKPRVKGIGEDAFRAMVTEAKDKADANKAKRLATASSRMKLSNLGPRPSEEKQAATWETNRQNLATEIREQVEAMRGTD